jgi:hypothetical protein
MTNLDFKSTDSLTLGTQPSTHIPTNREFMVKSFELLRGYLRSNGQLSETDKIFIREVMTRFMFVDLLLSKIEKVDGPNIPAKFDFVGDLDELYLLLNPVFINNDPRSIGMIDLVTIEHWLDQIIAKYYTPNERPSLLAQLLRKLFKMTH